MKNPNEPCTPGQTWGIFKITRCDVRKTFEQKGVTKKQASDLMQIAYDARNNDGSAQKAEIALNEALSNL